MLIINDIHIGVKRVAGTTPESAARLRNYLLDAYEHLLSLHDNVLVNGDMFDTYNIPLSDLLKAYSISVEWLQRDNRRKLHLVPGNHCLSRSSIDLSSFEMMARLLVPLFPKQVVYLQGGGWVAESQGVYAISHVVNQAEFDLQLDRVPQEAKTLLLHCNYDSPFTEHADHSLNLSRERAKALVERGVQVVLGHEHHPRSFFGGKVLIPGNQFPSSVSDCVTPEGRTIDTKHCVQIDNGNVTQVQTWSFSGDHGFVAARWDELTGDLLRMLEDFTGFIRISGEADPEDSAEALKRISKLRQKSPAFVVANAVRVRGTEGSALDLSESIEDVRKTDVVQMVIDTLLPEQAAVVRRIWNNNNNNKDKP